MKVRLRHRQVNDAYSQNKPCFVDKVVGVQEFKHGSVPQNLFEVIHLLHNTYWSKEQTTREHFRKQGSCGMIESTFATLSPDASCHCVLKSLFVVILINWKQNHTAPLYDWSLLWPPTVVPLWKTSKRGGRHSNKVSIMSVFGMCCFIEIFSLDSNESH